MIWKFDTNAGHHEIDALNIHEALLLLGIAIEARGWSWKSVRGNSFPLHILLTDCKKKRKGWKA